MGGEKPDQSVNLIHILLTCRSGLAGPEEDTLTDLAHTQVVGVAEPRWW